MSKESDRPTPQQGKEGKEGKEGVRTNATAAKWAGDTGWGH